MEKIDDLFVRHDELRVQYETSLVNKQAASDISASLLKAINALQETNRGGYQG